MRILIKYTLKSMMEKKFRSFLIIFAIALAGGLFLASSRLSDNVGGMYYNMLTASYGDSDISIYPDANSPSNYISLSSCEKIRDKTKCIVTYLSALAEYKMNNESAVKQKISIRAYNIQDYLVLNELSVIEGSIDDFTGNKIILSKRSAQSLGVSVGEELRLDIDGKRKVILAAIVDATGIFANEGDNISGIIPFDTISKYLRTNGRASTIFISLNQDVDCDEVISTLQRSYPKYVVEPTINTDDLEEQLSSITVPFMMMTLIVVFMSAFIIYSSFKVIMLEKLPVVGTFRSIGATKSIMNSVLLLECMFYGILGGLFACIIGAGALYILSYLLVSMDTGSASNITINIPIKSYITTLLMGISMALFSTIFPILSVAKISLKDIILNNRPHKHRKYLKGTIWGIALIVGSFGLAKWVRGDLAMLSSTIALFVLIIGVIKVLPMFVLYASKGIGILFKVVFGNIGELATKNIKKNSSVLNSITLITIGISILFTISTMTQNLADQCFDFYNDTFKTDVMCTVSDLDDQKLRIIKQSKHVEKIIESMRLEMKVPEFDDMMIYPEAIRSTQVSPDINYNILGNEKVLLQQLQEDRNIIATEFLRKKFDLEVGDTITLKCGKDSTRQYKIIGFMDTKWNNGCFGLLPLKYIQRDLGRKTYDVVYLSVTKDVAPEDVVMQLEERFKEAEWTDITTVKAAAEANYEMNASMMSLISAFAIMAMLIGVVGIINNLLISFIERRQSIAMLRSVGMSKWQVLKMIIIEGIGSGLIGAVGGLGSGVISCSIFDYIIEAMEMPIHMEIVPDLFLSYFIGGMLITVIGSVIPARGTFKLNIIEAIKYE